MEITHHRWWSPRLSQEMPMNVYGHSGKPVLVFPAECGTHREYEGFGMVEAVRPFIEAGQIQLFTLDSVDKQALANHAAHPFDRIRRHDQYDAYVYHEVIPFIRAYTGTDQPCLATGCSMGGYQSANFFFRHPDACNALMAQSGVYKLKIFIGEYIDEVVYYHTPLAYLRSLGDPWYLEQYRRSQIVICVGQGAWEDEMIGDTRELQAILKAKHIPAWVDFWGFDVEHDWPSWRAQAPYLLRHFNF